jgi:glycosyltransferase involved in cell wall biosynthesis
MDECPADRWARRNEEFCRAVLKQPWGNIDAVYGFNAASLELFEKAKVRGLRCILDQTAAPWRWNTQMLREEAARWPGWETDGWEIDVNGTLAAREEAEWALADTIVCGSRFAADMVDASLGRARTCVVSYPQPALSGLRTASMLRSGPLRVLYVGSLQLRKGIQYLWQSKQLLGGAIDVRVIGPSLLSDHGLAQLKSCMDIRGARPRSEVVRHLEWADAFVLPSLSEGSANACHEAMAAGVPTITTRNSGSLIRHGENGWVMPVRDADTLAAQLSDIDAIRLMRQRLQDDRALQIPRTLFDYGKELLQAIGCCGEGMQAGEVTPQRSQRADSGSQATQ